VGERGPEEGEGVERKEGEVSERGREEGEEVERRESQVGTGGWKRGTLWHICPLSLLIQRSWMYVAVSDLSNGRGTTNWAKG
jgi:hypothetical protein